MFNYRYLLYNLKAILGNRGLSFLLSKMVLYNEFDADNNR